MAQFIRMDKMHGKPALVYKCDSCSNECYYTKAVTVARCFECKKAKQKMADFRTQQRRDAKLWNEAVDACISTLQGIDFDGIGKDMRNAVVFLEKLRKEIV